MGYSGVVDCSRCVRCIVRGIRCVGGKILSSVVGWLEGFHPGQLMAGNQNVVVQMPEHRSHQHHDQNGQRGAQHQKLGGIV